MAFTVPKGKSFHSFSSEELHFFVIQFNGLCVNQKKYLLLSAKSTI